MPAVRVDRASSVRPDLRQELAVLEVCGDVFGMRCQQRLEMFVGSGGIAGVGALHCQAVAGERVVGFCGDEFFEHLAARFLLWLGHGHAHSIFALGRNAKFPREAELHMKRSANQVKHNA